MTHWKTHTLFLLCTIMLGTCMGVLFYSDDSSAQPQNEWNEIEDDINFDVLHHIVSMDLEGACELLVPLPSVSRVVFADFVCPGLTAGIVIYFPFRGPPIIG